MRIALLLVLLLLTSPALALTIEQPLADPLREQQAKTIFTQLKCMVCEGQTLAESDATLARQMRSDVRDMLIDGKSEQEVLDRFVARYGQQVLMNPPLQSTTWLLWGAPIILLGIGFVILKRAVR